MNPETQKKNTLPFISGGGEMGEHIRAKDWSKTPVGAPESWPQSLRTTLGIVLNSRFPMFLWWGPELTCFYNDAYRPSLGQNGKHPSILGIPAREAWPEIWDIIKPLIDQVLAGGEATWSEDQLIPIFRNGKIEDVYWTFSYSPVSGETGNIEGVLVTCTETTSKVNTLKYLEESNRRYFSHIMQAPVAMCIFKGREHTVQIANDRMLELMGKTSDEVINIPVFEALPEAKGQGLEEVLDMVYLTGEPISATDRPVQLLRNGRMETIFMDFVCESLTGPDGSISGIVAVATDVSAKVLARRKAEESEKKFRNTVMQMPMGITILHGPDFIVEMANESYLQFIDKKEKEFVGKPLFDSLPEVKDIVHPLLTSVLKTGTPFYAEDFPVTLNRYGRAELGYFSLVYYPLKEQSGEISDIIVVASEVTKSVESRHVLAQNELHFRNLVMQSPIPMAIFRSDDFIIEMANLVMFEKIWRKKASGVLGKKALEVFPELKDQKYPELLKKVMKSGRPHREKGSVAYVQGDDGLKKFYLDFEYNPLFDTDSKVTGIMITVNDTTEAVEARILAEENEQRLGIVIEASELGTWELNLKTDAVNYSDRYLEILGFKAGTKVNHTALVKRIHPDDLPVREKAFREAFITGTLNYEARIIWEDGSLHWMQGKGKINYEENGEPVMMVGTIRDITEEKSVQEKILQREQRFRLLADSMPQFVWTGDASGQLTYFNHSVFKYIGFVNQRKENWTHFIHPDDRAESLARWKESISRGTEFSFEHRILNQDGEYRWHLSRAIPQTDTAGNIHIWVGTSTDIQEQKMRAKELENKILKRTRELELLNEELIRSEHRYQMMIGEVQDYAIFYLNGEGIVENWNKGAQKIKGYSADEIIGKHFSVFYTDKDRERNLPKTLLGQAIREGKAKNEGLRMRKDKSLFWANVVITAIHDEHNKVIGFSKVTHDLTEKKRAEDRLKLYAAKLEDKNRELEKMNAELQSFAYISSHDLQEPLRKIQTFASRIEEKESDLLSETGRDYFNRMKEAARRMQTLIQDLLTYSRTSTSERVFVETDLNELAKELQSDFKETFQEKNATLHIGKMCSIKVIPFQFRQLMENLISNALKFSKSDVAPEISITSEMKTGSELQNKTLAPGGVYCHLHIADNGIGFDPQYKERIFEVFQRLHGKSEYSGTGIGLAIVKKIVENHNGLIEASSEPGKGSSFDIYIPVT